MTWIFHEPFDAAVHARRAFRPPAPPRSGFSAHHRVSATFAALATGPDEEWWAPPRRVTRIAGPLARRAFNPAAQAAAALMAAGLYEPPPPTGYGAAGRRLHQPGYSPVGTGGASAARSVVFAGAGDDPFGPRDLAGAEGRPLDAGRSRGLAIRNTAVFSGRGAGRAV